MKLVEIKKAHPVCCDTKDITLIIIHRSILSYSGFLAWCVLETTISVIASSYVYVGGPGGGCDAKDRSFFNPVLYKVR